MTSPVIRLTLRGVLARKFRILLTVFAIVSGVAFVSGAFMLTDSVKTAINSLFQELRGDIALEVRTPIAFGDEARAKRDPVPDALASEIKAVAGVSSVELNITRESTIVKPDGKPLKTSGPAFGISWVGQNGLDGRTILAGREARGPNEVAIDKASA
ncbi:MAG: ABC transporter permease, partial [Actinomycetes bacterium]